MFFNFKQNEVLGLDIGSSAVKIIQLSKDISGYAVIAAGIVDISPHEGDKVLSTVKAIRTCLELTGVQTKFAVCSVCGPEVAVRDFELPSLPPEETEGAILLEASQVCPFNIKDGSVDYQLIPRGDEKTSGVLVAVTDSIAKNKRQLVQEASLDCVLMDVDGLALLNCFSAYQKPQAGQTIAILNVGSSFTTLAIMRDNGLPFIRDLDYAGDDIVEQIATEKNLQAETVKKILCGESVTEQIELRDSLEKACNKLIIDVTKTSHYYKAEEKPAFVEKIFVSGGFAQVKGFVELLNNRLPAKAVLWNPFEKIRCKTGQWSRGILESRGPAMVVAAGLAMRSI
jgi:type IV pilus assembly protein PilM